jgi:hypothetical protein
VIGKDFIRAITLLTEIWATYKVRGATRDSVIVNLDVHCQTVKVFALVGKR